MSRVLTSRGGSGLLSQGGATPTPSGVMRSPSCNTISGERSESVLSRSGPLFTDHRQLATLNAAAVIGGAEGAAGLGGDTGKKPEAKRVRPRKLGHPGVTAGPDSRSLCSSP